MKYYKLVKASLEIYIQNCIRGKEKGMIPLLIKPILWLLSCFFRLAVACKNWAFDKGLMRLYTPPVPVVISIGNIVAGGTGKTPLTMAIANHFADEFTTAILSRGYRSAAEKHVNPIILSNGEGPILSAAYCGDEPFLLAKNVPKALVIVGKDRKKAAAIAVKAGAKLILLDDGMQHRKLARDYELVVMNGHDLFGKGHFLPRGFLRENKKALQRADLIVVNHVRDKIHFSTLKDQITPYTTAPVVAVRAQPAGVFDLYGNRVDGLLKAGLFCGIAHPESFKASLEELGVAIIDQYCIADHDPFDFNKLESFSIRAKAKGADWIVCTEKDKVRLPESPYTQLPIAWLKINLEIVEGKEPWNHFLHEIKEDIQRSI